jgi:uncharacterized protein DUF6292
MPVTEHTDGPVDDEVLYELAEHGLRHYIAQTANAVGVGPEAAWCEWADAPSAYIALDRRLPGHPDREAALIWAAERGWAVAVETGCGEDLLITASLGGDVLPAPDAVAAFVRCVVLADRHTDARACPRAAVDTNLARRLAGWAGHEPTVEGRTS